MIFLLSVDFSTLVAFHIWLIHVSVTVSCDELSSSLMFIVYLEKKLKLFTWKLPNILILTSFNVTLSQLAIETESIATII